MRREPQGGRMAWILGWLLLLGWGAMIVRTVTAPGNARAIGGGDPAVRAEHPRISVPASTAGSVRTVFSDNPKVAEKITVYVVGAVSRPGLYRLPLDARVEDAVRAAGGALRSADLEAVDLAAVAVDGTEIAVPERNGLAEADRVSGACDGGIPGVPSRSAARGRGKLAAGQRVNVNEAAADVLQKIPGIGAKRAEAILKYRTVHGRFTTLAAMALVPGIGEKLLERILPYLTLGP